jgi:hypothetical protein
MPHERFGRQIGQMNRNLLRACRPTLCRIKDVITHRSQFATCTLL